MAEPIWKDYYVTLATSGDSMQFRILNQDTGDTIYSGNAFRRPGETDITARINDICADWLEHVLPTLSQAEFTRFVNPAAFVVQALVLGTWTTKDTVEFLPDWSYDYGYDPSLMGMSFPINGRIDARMPILWTGYDQSQVDVQVNLEDGTTINVYIPVEITADFNDDFNDDFSIQDLAGPGSGTAVILPSQWAGVKSVEIGGLTYEVVTECARYALYYVNAYGGWDCLLVEGADMEADALKRYTMETVYDNRSISNRGIRDYVNEVTKGFTLHTGWLLHDQGLRMHHLINSTCVYLYDIPAGQMIPVTIPTASCEYKTYRNQGNRLVDYTLEVQVAQHRVRR